MELLEKKGLKNKAEQKIYKSKHMKRFHILFLLVIFGLKSVGQEQIITENQASIVYSLPKKIIDIQIEVEKTTQKPGIYFQYSERYLATNQVILEEKTSYQLKSILLSTHSVADPKRMYVIQPVKKSMLNYISVNNKGILCGVNTATKSSDFSPVDSDKKLYSSNLNTSTILPLGEEYLMAGSVAKLAEGAAKQIYRIRESRLSLLTGDIEHLPADGASMQTMIEGLNKSEKELTELFVGKTIITTEKQTISISADSAMMNVIAFRLSTFKGLVDATDLSGNPYYLSIYPEKIKQNPADPKLKNDKSEFINTILPAKTNIEISDGIKPICNITTDMPQFGVVIPASLTTIGTTNFKIQVDPQNGRLLSIEK